MDRDFPSNSSRDRFNSNRSNSNRTNMESSFRSSSSRAHNIGAQNLRSSGRGTPSYMRLSSTSSYTDLNNNLNNTQSNSQSNYSSSRVSRGSRSGMDGLNDTAPDLRFRQLQGKRADQPIFFLILPLAPNFCVSDTSKTLFFLS